MPYIRDLDGELDVVSSKYNSARNGEDVEEGLMTLLWASDRIPSVDGVFWEAAQTCGGGPEGDDGWLMDGRGTSAAAVPAVPAMPSTAAAAEAGAALDSAVVNPKAAEMVIGGQVMMAARLYRSLCSVWVLVQPNVGPPTYSRGRWGRGDLQRDI